MSTQIVDTSTVVERPTVYNTNQYNVVELLMPNVATDVASGAGAAVTVNVVFKTNTDFESVYPADIGYDVQATPSQACAVSRSAKTTAGFTLTLTPLTSGVTLAAGTVDIRVTYPSGGAG